MYEGGRGGTYDRGSGLPRRMTRMFRSYAAFRAYTMKERVIQTRTHQSARYVNTARYIMNIAHMNSYLLRSSARKEGAGEGRDNHSNANCHSYPINLLKRRPSVQKHANGEQHACNACRVEPRFGPSRLKVLAADERRTEHNNQIRQYMSLACQKSGRSGNRLTHTLSLDT